MVVETLTDEQASEYYDAHIEALTGIGKVVSAISSRGEYAKRAAVRALCENLAAVVATDHGIAYTDDGQGNEAVQAPYNAIVEWCEREKQRAPNQ